VDADLARIFLFRARSFPLVTPSFPPIPIPIREIPMRLFLCTLVLLLGTLRPLAAQNAAADREAVRQAALDYIEGFYTGDSTRLVRSVWPEVRKWGYSRQADSTYRGMAMPYPAFMRFAEGVRAGRNLPPAGAPKEITIYDVQDQTASAKVVAWWGQDYLLLARVDGRWMITHVLWQSSPPAAGRP
jgi:hypothetical protein